MKFIIGDLVDDILIHILSLLSSPDILTVRLVCKRLDSLSRESGVWCDVFEREVIDAGKPCPGYSHLSEPPRTLVETKSSSTASVHPGTDMEGRISFSNHSDLEKRTMHALRLEQKWRKRPNVDEALATTYELPETILESFLLRGGRFALTMHSDCLRCWDLGFPATDGTESSQKQHSNLHCVDVRFFAPLAVGRSMKSDTDTSVHWRAAQIGRFAIADNADISGRTSSRLRTCIILTVQCSSATEYFGSSKNTQDEHSGLLRQEAAIALPPILIVPINSSSEDLPASRPSEGKLGNLLHVHGNLLFFESFAALDACTEADGLEPRPRFAGIEVVNVSATLTGSFVSALLIYPDTRDSDCFGIYVHEAANHIVVIWRYGIGIYPIHKQLTRSSWLGFDTSQRVALFPSTIIALTEEVQYPISFTTCKAQGHGSLRGERKFDAPEPLTILARSRVQPQGLMQRVLFAIKEPQSPTPSGSISTSKSQYTFLLMRIPTPTPPQYNQPPPVHMRPGNAGRVGTHERMDGVQYLALGSSGRGVHVEANGDVFRCAPSTIVLPQFGGLSGGPGFTTTVDFWPHIRMDTLPTPFNLADDGSGREHEDVPGDQTFRPRVETQVRFDDGMGRLIASHTLRTDALKKGDRSVLTVMDFA